MSYTYERLSAIEEAVKRLNLNMGEFEFDHTKQFILDLTKDGRHEAAKDDENAKSKALQGK